MRFHYNDLETLLAQLAELDAAGIDAGEGLAIVRTQAGSRAVRELTDRLLEHYEKGLTLSQAMARLERGVHPIVRGLIAAGEKSGRLGEALLRGAQFLAMRRNVMSALQTVSIYPFAVLTVGALVACLVVFWIIPNQWRLVEQLHQELWSAYPSSPAFHLFQLGMTAMRAVAVLFLAGWLLALVMALVGWLAPANPRFHKVLVHLPGYGFVFRQYLRFHFVSVLALQIEHGIPLPEALETLAEDPDLPLVRSAAHSAHHALLLGTTLSRALTLAPDVFPPEELWLLQQAERYEKVPHFFKQLGAKLSEQIRNIELLVRRLEPLSIIVLGGMVAILAVALMLPLIGWFHIVKLGE